MLALDTPLVLFAIAFLTVLSLFVSVRLSKRVIAKPDMPTYVSEPVSRPVFLFDGGDLIDATPSARRLIADRPDNVTELDALVTVLEHCFPDLRTMTERLDAGQDMTITSDRCPDLSVVISDLDGLRKLSFDAAETTDISTRYEKERFTAREGELHRLRALTNRAPQLIWSEDLDGNLTWANTAYLTYLDQCSADSEAAGQVWPGTPLFADLSQPDPTVKSGTRERTSVRLHNEQAEHWFDVVSMPQDDSILRYAVEASESVRAEDAQRAFRQTLAKTFADLSTGLAIFDRRRQLTMFNPALLDMTDLPFEFLSARPSIDMVLDRLRDMRKLPEPRDYNSWREQFLALEAAAVDGTYSENWALPDGQTLRVTGRPHPDGAIAFLFEDITAEISLTRHFRTEIETSQSVLDNIDDAVAVFTNANTLFVNNAAYLKLWDIDDQDMLVATDLKAALRIWKAACLPAPTWRKIEDFAAQASDRQPWSETVMLTDGRRATCQTHPISGGMTMVRFTLNARATPLVRPHIASELVAMGAKG